MKKYFLLSVLALSASIDLHGAAEQSKGIRFEQAQKNDKDLEECAVLLKD